MTGRILSVPASSVESLVSDDLTCLVIKRALWNLFGSDRTLGESSPVVEERWVRSVVQRRVGDRTRPRRVRSLDLGASGQEYARAGASRWRATIIFEWLVHMAHKERPDFGPNSRVSSVSESGQCAEIRMKGVTTILALRAIKGVCGWPWHKLGTLGT